MHSPASLRNFSFTSTEQSLHVLMATRILSPVCKQTHTHSGLNLQTFFIFSALGLMDICGMFLSSMSEP